MDNPIDDLRAVLWHVSQEPERAEQAVRDVMGVVEGKDVGTVICALLHVVSSAAVENAHACEADSVQELSKYIAAWAGWFVLEYAENVEDDAIVTNQVN